IETTFETKGTKQEQEGFTEEDPSLSLFSEEREDPDKINKTERIRVNGKDKTKDEFHFHLKEEDKDLFWFEKSPVLMLMMNSPLASENYLEQMSPKKSGDITSYDQLGQIMNQNYILNTTLPVEMELPSLIMQEMLNNNNMLNNPNLSQENLILEDFGDLEPMNVDTPEQYEPSNYHENKGQEDNEYYEEEDEEPYEDDDTCLNLEIEQDSQLNTPSNPTRIEGFLSPALETYETHPTDQEVDNFINYSPTADQENANVSEASFHSIHNSVNSSSSMFHKIEELEEFKHEMSTSNSSKRKNNEGMDDTTSSDLIGGKKIKVLIIKCFQ
ncbi:hypothetical protein V2J09_011826, partial [Rumex salicifolius]